MDQTFFKEIKLIPRVSPEFELSLDNSPVIHAIQTMNFFQMKGEASEYLGAGDFVAGTYLLLFYGDGVLGFLHNQHMLRNSYKTYFFQ